MRHSSETADDQAWSRGSNKVSDVDEEDSENEGGDGGDAEDQGCSTWVKWQLDDDSESYCPIALHRNN